MQGETLAGSTAIQRISQKKGGNFRKLVKSMNSLSMYSTKNWVMNILLYKMLRFLRKRNMNQCTHCSAPPQIILLIYPIYLLIQFSFFLVDDLISNYGQQVVFRMDDNLFSSCHCGVTSGKAQSSELCLDVPWLSVAATRLVIMGCKCVHEGCQKSFESRKG